MSSKSWIIWTAMLTGLGLSGLWMVRVQEAGQAAYAAQCRQLVGEGTEKYLASYQQWSQLSAEDKAENQWGQGRYGGPEIQKSISADQNERLQGCIAELAGGQRPPHELSDILYGLDWRQKVALYRRDIERREMIEWGCSVAAGVGVLLFGCGIAVWTARKIFVRVRKTGENEEQNDKDCLGGETHCPATQETSEPAVFRSVLFERVCREPQEGSKAGRVSGGYFEAYSKKLSPGPQRSGSDAEDAGALLNKEGIAVQERCELPAPQASVWGGLEETSAGTMMTNEPVLSSLSELSEDVSAIRQFASQQQDQMRKLQDGYDWMLIRRFCLRIIRCVDNIYDRIVRLAEQGKDVSLLQDVHDELVFALESSGVEQYEPQTDIPYKGLEKYAEAVKERQENDQPGRSGCIASIARPGYQYLVNDEDVKIVRCAQVRLYQ